MCLKKLLFRLVTIKQMFCVRNVFYISSTAPTEAAIIILSKMAISAMASNLEVELEKYLSKKKLNFS